MARTTVIWVCICYLSVLFGKLTSARRGLTTPNPFRGFPVPAATPPPADDNPALVIGLSVLAILIVFIVIGIIILIRCKKRCVLLKPKSRFRELDRLSHKNRHRISQCPQYQNSSRRGQLQVHLPTLCEAEACGGDCVAHSPLCPVILVEEDKTAGYSALDDFHHYNTLPSSLQEETSAFGHASPEYGQYDHMPHSSLGKVVVLKPGTPMEPEKETVTNDEYDLIPNIISGKPDVKKSIGSTPDDEYDHIQKTLPSKITVIGPSPNTQDTGTALLDDNYDYLQEEIPFQYTITQRKATIVKPRFLVKDNDGNQQTSPDVDVDVIGDDVFNDSVSGDAAVCEDREHPEHVHMVVGPKSASPSKVIIADNEIYEEAEAVIASRLSLLDDRHDIWLREGLSDFSDSTKRMKTKGSEENQNRAKQSKHAKLSEKRESGVHEAEAENSVTLTQVNSPRVIIAENDLYQKLDDISSTNDDSQGHTNDPLANGNLYQNVDEINSKESDNPVHTKAGRGLSVDVIKRDKNNASSLISEKDDGYENLKKCKLTPCRNSSAREFQCLELSPDMAATRLDSQNNIAVNVEVSQKPLQSDQEFVNHFVPEASAHDESALNGSMASSPKFITAENDLYQGLSAAQTPTPTNVTMTNTTFYESSVYNSEGDDSSDTSYY